MRRNWLEYIIPIPVLAEIKVYRYYREEGDRPTDAALNTFIERSIYYSVAIPGWVEIYRLAKPLLNLLPQTTKHYPTNTI